MTMKQFTTAVAEAEETDLDEGKIEFEVDGFACTAYRPTEGQFAILMASTGRHSSMDDMVAGIINFVDGMLDDTSSAHLMKRLMDRKDKFELENVQEIMEWLIEEWTARPTQEPSGSTPSPASTGKTSKSRTSDKTS